MEIGEGGLCSDRLVELINYCVAGEGTWEESKLCSRAARIAPLRGRSGGISPLLQGLSRQCSRHRQRETCAEEDFWISSKDGVGAIGKSIKPT